MENHSLHIALGDADEEARFATRALIEDAGHTIVHVAAEAVELTHSCDAKRVDLLVTDVNIVDNGGYSALLRVLERHDVPIVVTSNSASDEAIDIANSCRPLVHLVKPIRGHDIRVAIALAVQRFDELKTLREEAVSFRQAIEDRKVIDRAKSIVMREQHIDEAVAFRRIQKMARDRRESLIAVAKGILVAEAMLRSS
jgi:AmiR/NasT family two-component response regulator